MYNFLKIVFCVLYIDINPFCDSYDVQRTDITWDVAGDRSYSYEISDSSGRVIGSKYLLI